MEEISSFKDSNETKNKNKNENDLKKGFFNKIIPIIGLFIGMMCYFASGVSILLLIVGSNLTRSIIVLLIIYQFFFCKKNETYRRFLKWTRAWDYFNSYTLIIEEELKESNCLFSFHPHGVLGFGFTLSASQNKILYDSVYCGSRAMINMPISGIFARWIGVHGVNNTNFKELMQKGKNISFVPGGFEEASITNYGKDRIFIKERKGFLKYALEYGYRVYPVYTFNENKLFYTVNGFEKIGHLLNKFKLPGIIFYSKYLIFPNYNIDLTTVIGKPIDLPKILKPTTEDVDKYHKLYINSLEELYNKYKKQFGASEELEIL